MSVFYADAVGSNPTCDFFVFEHELHIVPLIVPLIVPVIVLLLPREPHFPSFRISVHFPLSRIRMFDHILLISLSLSLFWEGLFDFPPP